MEILPDKETIAYRKASKRVKDLKEFYGNLTSYGIVIPFLAILNLMTAPGYLWFLWPALGWGIGIAFHAINVFGIGKSWEERKIRELMEKDEKQKIKTF
ncbi:2TM domain-containing protein [Chryseobacterium sp. WLY505]|uniref:2TM domain-containing protein n=1 Tax=Chryseobacterium sp. WLY505 TaxID=3068892 RepID=UPI0027969709|nr:2TM domain-containing protein [Chryseobacterium sp. WLY505]MDQ1856783.1 2TM domain-containing protein [Chryseobacterium sp. WLY505]